MAESHLVSGLKNLRAEKLGLLQQIREEIERLEAKALGVEELVGHLDHVLRDVEPGIDLNAVKPVRRREPRVVNSHADIGRHGLPVTQHILRVMRKEAMPMTEGEIVEILVNQRHVTDPLDRKKLQNSVYQYVYKKSKEGLLVHQPGGDGKKRYTINR